jgi:hypothetical protein
LPVAEVREAVLDADALAEALAACSRLGQLS